MDYELAKKLKDAGFQQTWPKPDFVELHDAIKIQEIMDKYEKDVYIPTLSELIEACGNRFDFLANNKNGTWQASGGNINDQTGQTPEEAVANLWLELNK